MKKQDKIVKIGKRYERTIREEYPVRLAGEEVGKGTRNDTQIYNKSGIKKVLKKLKQEKTKIVQTLKRVEQDKKDLDKLEKEKEVADYLKLNTKLQKLIEKHPGLQEKARAALQKPRVLDHLSHLRQQHLDINDNIETFSKALEE